MSSVIVKICGKCHSRNAGYVCVVAVGVPRMSLGFFPSLPYKERSPALQKNNWSHIRLVGKSLVSYWSRK